MSKKVLFKLGEDCEYFMVDGNLIPRSAIALFPAGKGEPEALPCGLGGVIHDNVLIESNTNPASSEAEWITNNQSVMMDIDRRAEAAGFIVDLKAAAEFPETELKHPDAVLSGCSQDIDAWIVKVNESPVLENTKVRTAGGHIHIGKGNDPDFNRLIDSDDGKIILTRLLDIFVGLPSVFLDRLEGSALRRTMYGKAGAFRPKPYGLEYRVMSPWWKQDTRSLQLIYRMVKSCCVEFVDNMQIKSVSDMKNYEKAMPLFEEIFTPTSGKHSELRRIINSANRVDAMMFYTEHVTPFVPNTLVREVMAHMEATA